MKTRLNLIIMLLSTLLAIEATARPKTDRIVVISDTHLLAPELVTPGSAIDRADGGVKILLAEVVVAFAAPFLRGDLGEHQVRIHDQGVAGVLLDELVERFVRFGVAAGAEERLGPTSAWPATWSAWPSTASSR